MSTVITWLVRWGHVVSAAVWVGSYALTALVIIPALRRADHAVLRPLAITTIRTGTYAGTLTVGVGTVLVTRTRGFAHLIGSEWGVLVLLSAVLALMLLALGDGLLRPALNRSEIEEDRQTAQRWAMLGLSLTVLTIGLMTRAVYAH